jgi:hypothetical protein
MNANTNRMQSQYLVPEFYNCHYLKRFCPALYINFLLSRKGRLKKRGTVRRREPEQRPGIRKHRRPVQRAAANLHLKTVRAVRRDRKNFDPLTDAILRF